jgi:hypothetical protein
LCLLAAVDVVFAVLTCSDPGQLSMKVGEEDSLESTCICSVENTGVGFVQDSPVYSYSEPGIPIVGKSVLGPDVFFGKNQSNFTVRYTFRGFDNMLGGEDSLTQQFQWRAYCTANDSIITESQVMNFTVQMNSSDAEMAALEPPAAIAIPGGCLVEGSETPVRMSFEAPNASANYRKLIGDWKEGDELPRVVSRPSGAKRFTASGEESGSWAAGDRSQPIRFLKGIEAEPDGHSLKLLFKPSGGAGSDESWKACMIPGDGFNWFPEICTDQFVVRPSQGECDDLLTTATISGGTSPLPSLASLFLGFVCVQFARLY